MHYNVDKLETTTLSRRSQSWKGPTLSDWLRRHEMSTISTPRETERRLEIAGVWRAPIGRREASLWGDGNILTWVVVMAAWSCEYVKLDELFALNHLCMWMADWLCFPGVSKPMWSWWPSPKPSSNSRGIWWSAQHPMGRLKSKGSPPKASLREGRAQMCWGTTSDAYLYGLGTREGP